MKRIKKHRHKWKMELTENPFAYWIVGKKPVKVNLNFCECGAVADKNKKRL